jgi:HK97 gp10 family phage protein
MPFSIQVEGMNELIRSMEKLPEKAAKVAAEALYEGAGIVADKVSGAVNGIATEPFKYAKGGRMRKPSPEEKALVAGAKHGVAKFRKNGVSVQTSVGYQNAGYGTINGKTKPIPQIANAINSGTSFMQKQPFMRKAFSQSKGPAQAAIEGAIHARENELNPD